MENWAKIAGGALATYECSDMFIEKCNFTLNTAGTRGVSIAFQESEILNYNHLTKFSVCDNFQVRQTSLTFIESEFWRNKAYKSRVLYV